MAAVKSLIYLNFEALSLIIKTFILILEQIQAKNLVKGFLQKSGDCSNKLLQESMLSVVPMWKSNCLEYIAANLTSKGFL